MKVHVNDAHKYDCWSADRKCKGSNCMGWEFIMEKDPNHNPKNFTGIAALAPPRLIITEYGKCGKI